MILAHRDSKGAAWYFRFDADRAEVAKIARRLLTLAVRPNHTRTPREYSRALLAESLALTSYAKTNAATAEEYEGAPPDERFVI